MTDIPMMAALLFSAHFVCDYPLQGQFLSDAKAKGPLRVWHLFGHAAIHGGAVALITGSVLLFVLETIAHTLIDELKVRGVTTFAFDQFLHVVCKIAWLTLIITGGSHV